MNVRLSPSKLNLLENCPRCFWLEMIKNIPRPSGPMSSIPIKMDSIIKNYFNKYRERNELPPILNGQVNGRLATNMPITLQLQVDKEIILLGRPDDYFVVQSGATIPFDHKTKSRPPDEIHPAHRLQLDVYSYLLRMNNFKTENRAFIAYYSPNNGDLHDGMPICCTVREVTTNPIRVKNIVAKARDILNGSIPRSEEHCEYCKWSQNLIENTSILLGRQCG